MIVLVLPTISDAYPVCWEQKVICNLSGVAGLITLLLTYLKTPMWVDMIPQKWSPTTLCNLEINVSWNWYGSTKFSNITINYSLKRIHSCIVNKIRPYGLMNAGATAHITLLVTEISWAGANRGNTEFSKNAFQSKAYLPLADRKLNTYNLILEWPWYWNDLDLVFDLDLRHVKPS